MNEGMAGSSTAHTSQPAVLLSAASTRQAPKKHQMQPACASLFLPEGRHPLVQRHDSRLLGGGGSCCSARSGAPRGPPRGPHRLWQPAVAGAGSAAVS
jgi:hypothetical protein